MAAPITDSNVQVSDEDWLIMRAKNSLKTDKYAAKAWMITAQTLFPDSFSIQFESYILEKNGGNVKEASKKLEKMYSVYSQEPLLVQEVKVILDVMQAETRDPATRVYTDIFAELATTTQCEMLLTVANQIQDHLEQCRLLLLAMKRFSSLVQEQGLVLVEKLLWSERQSALNTPVNSYRKLLVCDVVPLVLTKCRPQLSSKQLYKWLQKSMQFYVCYVTTPYSSDDSDPDLASPGRDLFSPTKKARRHASMSGLNDAQSTVSSPWTSLYKMLGAIGEVLKWELDAEYFTKDVDYQWVQIQNLYNRDKQTASVMHQKQILFTTVLLHLECLFNYVSAVSPDMFSHGLEAFRVNNHQVILLDSLNVPPTDTIPKTPQCDNQIISTPNVSNASTITRNFTTAIKSYDLLLSTELLKKDFLKLRQLWQMDSWTWTQPFHTHMAIYNRSYDKAIDLIQKDMVNLRPPAQVAVKLQLSSCLYRIRSYQKSAELLLDVITSLESTRDRKSDGQLGQAETPCRGAADAFVFTTFTRAEILPFCIQLMMSLFKEKMDTEKIHDSLLGHVIVLLQSDWPAQQSLFTRCISHITQKGSFSYAPFFEYIINVDILEDFAFIQSSQGGSIKMDVIGSHRGSAKPSGTTTRGVNRDANDEFTQLIGNQMRRCNEPVGTVVLDFIAANRDSILQTLS